MARKQNWRDLNDYSSPSPEAVAPISRRRGKRRYGILIFLVLLIALPLAFRTFGTVFIAPPEPEGFPLARETALESAVSRVALKASIPLATLQEILNQQAPQRFQGKQDQNLMSAMKDGWIEFDITRGAISLASNGERLFMKTPLGGRVSGGGNLKIPFLGDTPVRGTIDLKAGVSGNLAPVLDEVWSIEPNLTANLEIEKASLNLANLASVDVSHILENAIQPEIAKILEQLKPELNKESGWKRSLAQIWGDLHRVEAIDSKPPLWVSVRPTEIAMRPLDYSNKSQIQAVFGIDVEVTAHLTEPPLPIFHPLPNLKIDQALSPRSNLKIPTVLPLSAVNEHLKQETIEIELGSSDHLYLNNLHLQVLDSQDVLVRADFSATRGLLNRKAEGVLFLRGHPIIDLENQQLAFSNLDFTLETQGLLERSAVWLLKPGLRNELSRALRFEFSKELAKVTEGANQALRNFERPEGLEGDVKLEQLRIEHVYLIHIEDEQDAFVILMGAEAGASLRVGILQL